MPDKDRLAIALRRRTQLIRARRLICDQSADIEQNSAHPVTADINRMAEPPIGQIKSKAVTGLDAGALGQPLGQDIKPLAAVLGVFA